MDPNRIWFLRGLLAAFASDAKAIDYEEIRRLGRFNKEQLGEYLNAARQGLRDNEPDFCSIVVGRVSEEVGHNWGDVPNAPAAREAAFRYWHDRRQLDNQPFTAQYGALPMFPGLNLDEPVEG
jgi:hypothetical protein